MCRYHQVGMAVVVFNLLLGCSRVTPPGGPRAKTYPVTAVVCVDGEPRAGVGVKFYPQPNAAAIKFMVAANSTDDGKLTVSTYNSGDGLPEGTYKVTFQFESNESDASTNEMRRMTEKKSNDLLKGAYANPATSAFEVTVDKGKKNDFGTFELSTKGS